MKTFIKILHWAPRILCILAILFIGMFGLDSFDSRLTIWQQLFAFIMHSIPCLILIIFLIVAWKYEIAGGIIFILVGIGFTPLIFHHNFLMNHSVWISLGIVGLITFPFVLVGGLFLASHYFRKKAV